jgi:RNase adaptor protein for sRNA GlmZ degradation
MTDLLVYSFGYGHNEPPPGQIDITVDVRDWFRDPHIDPALREMTGLDQVVVDKVMATAGVTEFVTDLAGLAVRLCQQKVRAVVVAVGCVGGRHRSVVIADRVAAVAGWWGYAAEVKHLHVDRPVIRREVAK